MISISSPKQAAKLSDLINTLEGLGCNGRPAFFEIILALHNMIYGGGNTLVIYWKTASPAYTPPVPRRMVMNLCSPANDNEMRLIQQYVVNELGYSMVEKNDYLGQYYEITFPKE